MSQKILIAVDGSESSLNAVKHVRDVMRGNREIEITLLHVLEIPPSIQEHAGPKDLTVFEQASTNWEDVNRARVEAEILGPCKKVLLATGMSEDLISIRMELVETSSGVAPAILRSAEAGGYHVVVVGRRGRSSLMELMLGSVSSKIVHHARSCAVWIVG